MEIVQVKKYLSNYDYDPIDGYLSLEELQDCLAFDYNISVQCLEEN